jgi:hypothetical protein
MSGYDVLPFLAGLAVGVGGTLLVQYLLKKKIGGTVNVTDVVCLPGNQVQITGDFTATGTNTVCVRLYSFVYDDETTVPPEQPPPGDPPAGAKKHEPPASGNSFDIIHDLPTGLSGPTWPSSGRSPKWVMGRSSFPRALRSGNDRGGGDRPILSEAARAIID